MENTSNYNEVEADYAKRKRETRELIRFRYYRDSDENFVYSTWLNALYFGNLWFGQIPEKIFNYNYRQFIKKILSTDGVLCCIVCLREDEDVILGYSVSNGNDILHWIYIKEAWRKKGIAKLLIPDTVKTITHLTQQGLDRKQKKWIFNPWKL